MATLQVPVFLASYESKMDGRKIGLMGSFAIWPLCKCLYFRHFVGQKWVGSFSV